MTGPIWIHPINLQNLNAFMKNTLVEHLGIEFIDFGDSFLIARMPIKSNHRQPMGLVHGGATAALAETVANTAANFCVEFLTKTCVGVELNINHLRAIKDGYVDAIASPLHRGKSTQVWEIKIYNNNKLLVSAARLTVAVIEKR